MSDAIHKDWNFDGVMHLKLFYVSQLSYYIQFNTFDVYCIEFWPFLSLFFFLGDGLSKAY